MSDAGSDYPSTAARGIPSHLRPGAVRRLPARVPSPLGAR